MAKFQFQDSDRLKDTYLEQFLGLIQQRIAQEREAESALFPSAQSSAEDRSGRILHASRIVSYYEKLHDRLAAISHGKPSSLSAADLSAAFMLKDGKDFTAVVSDNPLAQSMGAALGATVLEINEETPADQWHAIFATTALVEFQDYFNKLFVLQENKVDEYICTQILGMEEAKQAVCNNGHLNKTTLMNHLSAEANWKKFVVNIGGDEEIQGMLEAYLHSYVARLSQYKKPETPTERILDVFKLAEIQFYECTIKTMISKLNGIDISAARGRTSLNGIFYSEVSDKANELGVEINDVGQSYP